MTKYQWKTLEKGVVLQHPFLRVEMEKVCLPNNQIIPDWPMVYMREYVNVFALNELGQALILEGYRHGPDKYGWQVVGGYLEIGEEPLQAIQRELLEETGFYSDDWKHLGSYVFDANRNGGMGHYYLARNVRQKATPQNDDGEKFTARWVALDEIKESLLDGRFITLTYAATIALGIIAMTE